MAERELTLRAVTAGCVLGAIFAVGNVYVGLKTGLSDAATVTAAILGFAAFRTFGNRPYTVLENNITQNVSSSAAVMPAAMGLLASFPALTMMNEPFPMWIVPAFGLALGFFGILMALALAPRFLSDPSMPFPDAIATAEVIRVMHRSGARALGKAKALMSAALGGGIVTWFRDGAPRIIPTTSYLPFGVMGIGAQPLGLGLSFSPLLIAVGMLIGPRTGLGLFVGGVLGWAIVAPTLVLGGVVSDASYDAIGKWLMWPGAALMIAGALTSLARDWRLVGRSVRDVRALGSARLGQALVVPGALAVAIVVMGWKAFDVHPLPMIGAIAITLLMAVIGARSVGETAVIPLGTIGQLTQLMLGPAMQAPTGSIIVGTVPAASIGQTAQMLETLKVGRLLGAAPRSQIMAQLVGACVGAPFAVAAYIVLTRAHSIGGPDLPAPTALPWKVLAELAGGGAEALPPLAGVASLIALACGVVLTLLDRSRIASFVPSPFAVGLAFVLGAAPSFTLALGALVYALLERTAKGWTREYGSSVAAGGLVGEAVMGIVVALMNVAHWL